MQWYHVLVIGISLKIFWLTYSNLVKGLFGSVKVLFKPVEVCSYKPKDNAFYSSAVRWYDEKL